MLLELFDNDWIDPSIIGIVRLYDDRDEGPRVVLFNHEREYLSCQEFDTIEASRVWMKEFGTKVNQALGKTTVPLIPEKPIWRNLLFWKNQYSRI